MINKQIRDKIVAQALQEIQFARTYKQGKVTNWQKNEAMYYGLKQQPESSRANVDLGLMQSFVHTLLSKIDNPLVFKFTKRKDAQLKRVNRLNGLRTIDQQRDYWDMKDIVGKKQAIIYGRAIYSYYADSYNGYCPHLDNVDVYDYLIDPSAGGIDIEKALNMGRYGVIKTKAQLKQGVKDGLYLKYEAQNLIDGSGNAADMNQEQVNKQSRTYDQGVWQREKENNPDKYVFWEWYTTDAATGDRYYLLLSEKGGTAIRMEKLSDIFESNLWPFWTWASFPDLTEFWTPAYCDYVRETFMAQAVSINQMLDNAEQINKPQKVVNVGAIENLAELKYRRDGYIKVKKDFNVQQALQTIIVPSIDTPIKVYELLDGIQGRASGVTAADQGVAQEDKVGIYEGNQAAIADRYGLLNKSYSYGYRRFSKLYEAGVREHLTKKVAIDILGPNGVEIEEVTRRDIFRKDEDFGVTVEASNAELAISETEKRTKLTFLSQQVGNPIVSSKKSFEIQASIAGFNEEDIRQLLDTSEFGDADLMSEAERDIERILDGERIKPNANATTAYKQRFVDYMKDNEENISPEQFRMLANYVISLEEIIIQNTVRQMNQTIAKDTMTLGTGGNLPQEQPVTEDINRVTTTNNGI